MRKFIGGFVALNLVMLVVLGCGTSVIQQENTKKIQRAQDLMTSQPAPLIKFSMDRYLLSERQLRFNDPNKMCYLYMCFIDGTWLQATIIGKMTSTSKRLTPLEMVTGQGGTYYSTPAPDEMATWGNSDPAHMGMTTLGSLIEAGGFMSYIYSETPITFKNMNKPMVELVVVASAEERELLMGKLNNLKREMSK